MTRWLIMGVVAAGVVLAGCGAPVQSAPESPSRLMPVPGTSLNRVVLTPQAVERIGLRTTSVQRLPAATAGEAVPLTAVIYLNDGSTWVYIVSGSRTYVRQRVSIAQVSGDMAVLQSGPTPGASVVTTGAAELLGSELGVAGGQ